MENGETGEFIGQPMWLSTYGKRRREIKTANIYHNYAQRFDLEHFFRFGKNKLLMTSYQTPEVMHEERYLKLCLVAHAQLFMARKDGDLYLKPWEKYSQSTKLEAATGSSVRTPTQAQRSFSSVLSKLDTFAISAKKRGKSLGRQKGYE